MTRHAPSCTWYRDAAECDCEELLMVLDSPALADHGNSSEHAVVSVLTAVSNDRTLRA